MANKITKKDNFTALRTLVEKSAVDFPTEKGTISNDEMIKFIDHELELLAKKSAGKDGEKKQTEKQQENERIQGEILMFMEKDTPYTVSQLLGNVPNLPADMSHHRMVANLSALVNSDDIARSKGKGGVTLFTLVV